MKILIIYATAGAGHRRAAEAIYNAAVNQKNHEVILVDSLDHTNPFFKKIYSRGYHFLISKLPWLWAFAYYALDNAFIYAITCPIRRLIVHSNSRCFANHIVKENPDVIITTQFFANEVVYYLKKKNLLNPKLICVITDFGAHSFWLSEAVDIYVAGSLDTKEDLINRGINSEQIKVLGIPIDAKFNEKLNRNDIAQKLGIQPDKLTGLIMIGAVGIGPISQIVDRLKSSIQLIVVCGNNKKLYAELKSKESNGVKIFGLVNNVHELMSVSDFIITKPGGLSICESLAKSLPMIFISTIPGQESKNAKFIIENGLGTMPRNIEELVNTVNGWNKNREVLRLIKDKIQNISSSNAAEEILNLLK